MQYDWISFSTITEHECLYTIKPAALTPRNMAFREND